MSPAQELLSLGNVELVGAPSTSWKTKSGMVNWQLGSMGTGNMHTCSDIFWDVGLPFLGHAYVCGILVD